MVSLERRIRLCSNIGIGSLQAIGSITVTLICRNLFFCTFPNGGIIAEMYKTNSMKSCQRWNSDGRNCAKSRTQKRLQWRQSSFGSPLFYFVCTKEFDLQESSTPRILSTNFGEPGHIHNINETNFTFV